MHYAGAARSTVVLERLIQMTVLSSRQVKEESNDSDSLLNLYLLVKQYSLPKRWKRALCVDRSFFTFASLEELLLLLLGTTLLHQRVSWDMSVHLSLPRW